MSTWANQQWTQAWNKKALCCLCFWGSRWWTILMISTPLPISCPAIPNYSLFLIVKDENMTKDNSRLNIILNHMILLPPACCLCTVTVTVLVHCDRTKTIELVYHSHWREHRATVNPPLEGNIWVWWFTDLYTLRAWGLIYAQVTLTIWAR